MGFRFRKSKKIAPGVRLNFSKKSVGVSVGNKLGGFSFNSKNGSRSRVSIPGTGISYSSKIGGQAKTPNNGSPVNEKVSLKAKLQRKAIIKMVFGAICLLGGIGSIGGEIGAIVVGCVLGISLFVSAYVDQRRLKAIESIDDELND